MDNDGMVAVVRGTRDSGIRVTLLDGNTQYTLLPNTVAQPIHTNNQASQYAGVAESGAQAIDGRYASVYQTVHCNLVPTSPAVDVSEFPPQRAALSKGHGNFQVGGLGSGETTFQPLRVKESFRGGLSWPERGSVFSARPSLEPDAFANSLRKYPTLSPERSSEMVERLINYAQFKNSKTQRFQNLRSESSNRPRKTLEADIRTDESPTRERSRRYYDDGTVTDRYERARRSDDDRNKKYDEGDRRFDRSFDKNYEVRNVREILRRGKDLVKNPFTHPVCPTIKERYLEFLPDEKREPLNVQISIDTQVEIPMSSKEVETIPRIHPSKRNVAIPVSPSPSILALHKDTKTSKSIQTLITQQTLFPRKSVQTCFSSIDITNKKIKNRRKSKSQEELRDNYLDDEVLQLVQDLGPEERGSLRDDLLKKLKKIYKADKSDRVKIKVGRSVRDQLFSDMELKDFTRELSNQLLSKIKKNGVLHYNSPNLYRAEIQSYRDNNDENYVDDVIEEWLRDIPIKNRDYLGKSIKKDHLLLTIAKKIKGVVISKLKLDGDKSLKTEIIEVIEDIPIAICGNDKRLYLNRLATDLVRRIKETICSYKVGKSNKSNINDAIVCKNSTTKEEEIKYYVREELIHFVRKFHLRICTESMVELEIELTYIILDAMDGIRSGKEEKVREEILDTLFDLLNITEYQGNYFANNMILNMKKMLSDVHKVKSQTFIELDKQRVNNDGLIDGVNENDIKANLVWYTNQIIQQINKWISSIRGLDPNDNFTKVVIHDLAGDIVDRHKYLELNPKTKVSKTDEIEHLKYQIFKWINKLVGDDNFETIEKAPELMERIRNIPVPILIKSHNTTQGYFRIGCDYNNRPYGNCKQSSIIVDCDKGIARSNITVAIGSVTQNKASPSDSEESKIEDMPPSQAHNTNKVYISLPVKNDKSKTAKRTSDPTGSKPPCCNNKQCYSKNTPAEQKTQDQAIDEFDQFLKDWVQKIPMSERPEHTEKCRLGIYNGVWKAISKIKMNPEALDNPLFYKDVLDDEIEELLDCLTQTPELKKQRNGLKAEVLDKAADIYMHVAPAVLNTSYKQQLVENISNNLPKTSNRVDHSDQDVNKLYEEVMKLHLAEYFILYTKYKEDDTIKANVFKRKLLEEVHELVEGIKQTHGKELREIEVKQYVEGVIHALQKVPVPNEETINQETDEIILALEVEQWFSDLPLIPNEERMDVLSRRKYREMLAKKLFDLENSNEVENEEEMKEEITKFLKRMPFIPGEAENMPFMVDELIVRVKNRPKDVDDDGKKAVAFVEPHGYEAFCRDMPLCSSYSEDQNGSSYLVVGGERAEDRSMAYGGQHVQGRNDQESQQEWLSVEQRSAPGAKRGSLPGGERTADRSMAYGGQYDQDRNDPESQQEWLSLDQTAAPRTMRGSMQGGNPCCGQPIGGERAAETSMAYGGQYDQDRNDPESQQEWLSLDQTAAPRGMRGSMQGASPCCGQPIGGERAAERSMAYGSKYDQDRNDPESQQEWLSVDQTAATGGMRGSLQGGGPCCGRPSCSQTVSSPRRISSPVPRQGDDPCCGRPSCLQNASAPRHSTSSPRRSSSPAPQQGDGSCCGRPSCLQSISSPRSSTSSPRRSNSLAPQEGADHSCGRPTCIHSISSPRSSTSSPRRSNSLAPQEGADHSCGRPTCLHSISSPQSSTSSLRRSSLPTPQQGTDPCCGRPTCLQSTSSPRRTSSPASQQGTDPYCGRPTCLHSTSAHRRSASSPRHSSSPAPQQGDDPCCGRPTCLKNISAPRRSTSSPRRNSSPADHQEDDLSCGRPTCLQSTSTPQRSTSSHRRSSSPAPQQDPDPCCGRPDCAHNTTLPPRRVSQLSPSELSSPKKMQSVEKLKKTPSAMKNNNFPPEKSAGPCCKRTSQSQVSTSSQTYHSLPILDTIDREPGTSKEQSPSRNLSKTRSRSLIETKGQKVSRGQSPGRGLSDDKLGPVTSKTKPEKSKPSKRQSSTTSLSDNKLGPVTSKTKTGKSKPLKHQPSASSLSDDKSAKSKTKLKKPKRSSKVECECFETPPESHSTSTGSKGRSPARTSLPKDKLGPVTSKTKQDKSKTAKRQSSGSSLSDEKSGRVTSKTKLDKTKPDKTKPLKGQSSASSLSNPKLQPTPSKTKPEKSKPLKGRFSGSSLSDDKSGPVKSKTKNSKLPRGQSTSSLSDVKPATSKTKPKKLKPPPTVDCGCYTIPKPIKESSKTTRRHSKLPENTKASTSGPNYGSEEDSPGRPARCSSRGKPESPNKSKCKKTPEGTKAAASGPKSPGDYACRPAIYSSHRIIPEQPDLSRTKKRSKDIEQERREAARRRSTMDDTDESDRDDVRCKCMERVWRWRRRQCRPCEDNPDMDFMYPFPMMYPPPPYYY